MPGMNPKAVPICSVEQYLWGNIVWRAADSLLPLTRTLDKRCETKVTSFAIHIAIKDLEQVPKLKTMMDHLVGVHVEAGTNEWYHKELRFQLCEDTTAVEHAHDRANGTELWGHVDRSLHLRSHQPTETS